MNLKSAVRVLSASVVFSATTFAVPVVLDSVSVALGGDASFGSVAHAQDQGKEKTRVTPAMSESMFKKFGKVQELGNPEDGSEGDPQAALRELNEVAEDCREDCNKYELAIMYNYFGWLYYSLERPQDSIDAYENLLAQSPEIPLGLELSTMYRVAQLNYAEDNYQQALQWINKWMEMTESVGADAYVMRARIHYQLGDSAAAISDVDRGVAMVEQKGEVPDESWYNLQRALYLNKEDYLTGIEIIEKMLVHYPKVSYWRQLAQLYGAVGRENDQLYILDALYVSGLLENKTEIKNLALLVLSQEVPYKAATILEKAIDEEVLEADTRNLETLANALRLAQEIERSIPVMARAASKAETGNLFAQLAAIYLDGNKNQEAIDAAEQALDKGEVRQPGYLYMTKGTAHYNLEQYDAAIAAFREATKIKESGVKDAAGQWIQHVAKEKERSERLRREQEADLPEPPPTPSIDA